MTGAVIATHPSFAAAGQGLGLAGDQIRTAVFTGTPLHGLFFRRATWGGAEHGSYRTITPPDVKAIVSADGAAKVRACLAFASYCCASLSCRRRSNLCA